MKIAAIETFQRDPELALVRVRTDDGLEGWGQTSPNGADLSVPILHRMVAPYFVDKDPWDLEVLVQEFVRATYKYPSSLILRALCGIDTAIWDLLGQSTGLPVYKLLGGAARDRVPVYASSMRRDISPEEEADRLAQVVKDHGFRCVKIRVGAAMGRDRDAAPGRTARLIPHVREVLGDDVDIHADANGGYSASAAIRVGRLLEEHSYAHFEEPCPYQEIENTRRVAEALDIPVAGGEQDSVLEQIHRIIATGAVDIIQPDIGYIGGVSRARRVVRMAEAAGIPCTPHCSMGSMLQVFTLHLAKASPGVSQYQEWSIEDVNWIRDLYTPVPIVEDGEVDVANSPGWGVSAHPDYLASADYQITTTRSVR